MIICVFMQKKLSNIYETKFGFPPKGKTFYKRDSNKDLGPKKTKGP